MTNVAILPVPTDHGGTSYHAIAGTKQSAGATADAALDALTAQLSADETSALVIVQGFRPDQLTIILFTSFRKSCYSQSSHDDSKQ